MQKLHVLLADSSPKQLTRLHESISVDPAIEVIGTCTDGLQTFNLARATHPDLIVCDVVLPSLDGLSLLKRYSRASIRPAFILTSSLSSDLIAQQAGLLGAEYFLLKPFDPEKLREVIHLSAEFRTRSRSTFPDEPSHQVYRILVRYGFLSHMRGFQYLATGVQRALAEPSLLHNLNKALYVQIAECHHTSAARVERDIRHAITTTCSRTGMPHLTNGAMLRRIVQELRKQTDNLAQL